MINFNTQFMIKALQKVGTEEAYRNIIQAYIIDPQLTSFLKFCVFFLSFQGCTHGIWRFPG